MKKALLPVALLLTAAGSWAFYPKPAEPEGYMMVVSRFYRVTTSDKISLTVLSPDGKTQVQEFDANNVRPNKADNVHDQLRTIELLKLNELKQLGWHVVSNNQLAIPNSILFTETTYLLEKK